MADLRSDLRPAQRYRFGVFEADSATGELRRQGMRVKLNAQPFQVLLMLLDRSVDRPGQLLTRDEISRVLWPEGTFVDFEHGVNSAINRIREALGDTAGSPRFVETLARRGYRFLAPVERISSSDTAQRVLDESEAPPSADALERSAQHEPKPRARILSTAEDLPKTPFWVVQTLFVFFQLMYLGFYIGALANLAEIEDLLAHCPLPRWSSASYSLRPPFSFRPAPSSYAPHCSMRPDFAPNSSRFGRFCSCSTSCGRYRPSF